MGEDVWKRSRNSGVHPSFKSPARDHHKSKRGASVVPQIDNCLEHFFTLLNSHYIWSISTLILNISIHVQMCSGLFSWQDNSREWNSDLHWLLYQCCNTVTRHAVRWEIIVMIYLLNVDIHGPPILLHELKNKILSMSLNFCLIIHENWPNYLNISIFYFEPRHFMAQMFQLYLQLISKVVDLCLQRYRPKK